MIPRVLRLRDYNPEDFPAVCAVHDRARPMELNGAVPASAFAPMADEAEDEEFFDSATIVACEDNCVVGFISFKQSYITWLYVDPAHHRHGIASTLLTEALRRIGASAWVNTLANNRAAIALYRKFDFDTVKEFDSDCDGHPCRTVRLALPTSPMHNPNLTRAQFEHV